MPHYRIGGIRSNEISKHRRTTFIVIYLKWTITEKFLFLTSIVLGSNSSIRAPIKIFISLPYDNNRLLQ